jgi:DNA-binding transcriptional ArsR family regulator
MDLYDCGRSSSFAALIFVGYLQGIPLIGVRYTFPLALHSTSWLNISMNHLNTVLDAISHPSRRAILERLSRGPSRVTEIAEPFEMSLNAISKHLKVLEGAGLIHREVRGREHFIEFRGEPLRLVSSWVHHYEQFWGQHLDRFEDHFKQKRKTKP